MIDSDTAARAQLTDLLNEALLTFRGKYAMFGGLSWGVVDVSRAAITVHAHASGKAATDLVGSAMRLRNCALAFLRDIVPSEKFIVKMHWGDAGRVVEVVFPYVGYDGPLDNNVILIEEVCEPKRVELRRAIAPLFARLS